MVKYRILQPAWTRRRNRDKKKIKWGFDRAKADKKLSKYYIE